MRIALTFTGSPEKHSNYENWLKDESVEVVRISAEEGNLKLLTRCDGLVLSGGIDIHPQFYGSDKLDYPHADAFDINRDEFEIATYHFAVRQALPVLGICRGLQLINCIHGGSLRQDLGEKLNKTHRGSPDKRHKITVEKSKLNPFNRLTEGEVNSSHHQAIDRLGEGLVANCRSEDGVIEGVEWGDPENKPYMLAVQWHPERMEDRNENPLSRKIRDSFIEAVKTAKA